MDPTLCLFVLQMAPSFDAKGDMVFAGLGTTQIERIRTVPC